MNYTQKQFYRSPEWIKFRRAMYSEKADSQGNILCELCGKPIVNKYDAILDHIEELNDDNVNDATISLNPNNVRWLHMDCHNRRHERFGRRNWASRARQIYIVYGPLCFKNLEYVKSVASENDLVIDINNLYEALTINNRYHKPLRLTSTVFSVHDHLLDIVKHRTGRWQNAYIVTTAPRSTDRKRIKDRVNADEMVFIDVPYADAMALVQDNKEWVGYVENWFSEYDPD